MKTCFIVHNAAVARALRSNIGPDARVVVPGESCKWAIERLVVVDVPGGELLGDLQWARYTDWLRTIVAINLVPDAPLVNVPEWARTTDS